MTLLKISLTMAIRRFRRIIMLKIVQKKKIGHDQNEYKFTSSVSKPPMLM